MKLSLEIDDFCVYSTKKIANCNNNYTYKNIDLVAILKINDVDYKICYSSGLSYFHNDQNLPVPNLEIDFNNEYQSDLAILLAKYDFSLFEDHDIGAFNAVCSDIKTKADLKKLVVFVEENKPDHRIY